MSQQLLRAHPIGFNDFSHPNRVVSVLLFVSPVFIYNIHIAQFYDFVNLF